MGSTEREVRDLSMRHVGLCRRKVLVIALVCIAVAAAVYALIIPGRALELFQPQPICGLEEHTHGEDCYTRQLICGMEDTEGHTHTSECESQVEALICGLEETKGHAHTDGCLAIETVLICGLEESAGHVHSDGCFMPGEEYIACGLDEDENHTHTPDCMAVADSVLSCSIEGGTGHVHGDGCYETQDPYIACGLEEITSHSHNDSCYRVETVFVCGEEEWPAHTHTGECYAEVLTCTLDEHTHTDECFEHEESRQPADIDRETADQWERTFEFVELTGNRGADLAAIANTQLGYRESRLNYVVDELGIKHGYTRYGQWYGIFDANGNLGDPLYGADPDACRYFDWDALFVAFCLNYAGITPGEFPYGQSAAQWAQALALEQWSRFALVDSGYVPMLGDLVFFDNDFDGTIDHMGIVAGVSEVTHEPEEGTVDEMGQPIPSVVERTLTVIGKGQTFVEGASLVPRTTRVLRSEVKAETVALFDPNASARIVGYGIVSGQQPSVPDGSDELQPPIEEVDSTADVETADIWEASIAGVSLTGGIRADVIAIAQSQIGYAESTRNYILGEDGETRYGYTRYGQWYGDPYGDWCAMFASFCLSYAGVQDYPLEANCACWIEALAGINRYQAVGNGYIPQPGDLVFYDMNQDGVSDHVGIVEEASTAVEWVEKDAELGEQADFETAQDKEAALEPELVQNVYVTSIVTIEGNVSNAVNVVSHDGSDPVIMGYGSLFERTGFTINGKDAASSYTWNYADGLMAMEVVLSGAAVFDGELPVGAEPVLEVEIGSPEEAQQIIDASEDVPADDVADSSEVDASIDDVDGAAEDIYPLMTMKLCLKLGDEVIDITSCEAQTRLVMACDVAAAVPSTLDIDGVSTDQGMTVKLYDGQSEVAAAVLDEAQDGSVVLNYTTHGGHVIGAGTAVSADPTYTLQHYFWFPAIEVGGEDGIIFINASSGDPNAVPSQIVNDNSLLPQNGRAVATSNGTFTVSLVNDAELGGLRLRKVTDTAGVKGMLTRIFDDEPNTKFSEKPQVSYMSCLYNSDEDYNPNYTLEAIWVYQPESDKVDLDQVPESAFTKYEVPVGENGVGTHNPESIRFTNNAKNQHLTKLDMSGNPIPNTELETYPYVYTILIQQDTVVRLVFGTTQDDNGIITDSASFFDYDITDGYIYKTAGGSGQTATSEQGNGTWYAKTNGQGINNSSNYTGNGSKYAFGNNNTGTGMADVQWNGNNINKRNGSGSVKYENLKDTSYRGCAFGLVSGFTYDASGLPIPIWSSGISAPDIFSANDRTTAENAVIGKTAYTNGEYQLDFSRDGGTYTLQYVRDVNGDPTTQNLRTFVYNGLSYSYGTSIYSNNFWPLSKGCASWGTDGHDLKFGDYDLKSRRLYGSNNYFPETDPTGIGYGDQNAYFGMSFEVDFTIQPGYASPLNYWFYGDDDMWVFLSEIDDSGQVIGNTRLVADIGGVHTSVGEYVNLWDYVPHINYTDESGNPNQAKSYRLTVFYTERGASGSSCYMRFTVPSRVKTKVSPERSETLVFEKTLLDEQGNVAPYDYSENAPAFSFELNLTDSSGSDYQDAYEYAIYQSPVYDENGVLIAGVPNHKAEGVQPIEQGVIDTFGEDGKYHFILHGGEYIVISNLPDGTEYTVREEQQPNYVTYYQLGRHMHVNGQQVDSLESSNRYGYVAGHYAVDAYNYVRFTNGPALKTEVAPGDGQAVSIGSEIVYEIEWGNSQSGDARVFVTDVLDAGVDFVGAAFGAAPSESDGSAIWWVWNGVDNVMYDDAGNTISYDPNTRTVQWAFANEASGAVGIVSLKVRVNENALLDDDNTVTNQATITVGNQLLVTNKVENPTWQPEKTEVDPGEGELVRVGDKVVYRITWKNYTREDADVQVRDLLDVGAAFDPAVNSAKAYLKQADGSFTQLEGVTASYRASTEGAPVTDDNNPDAVFSGELGWNLGTQPSGAEGYVEFDVTVTEQAVPTGGIWNWGHVKVNGDAWVETNHIWNPVPTYELPATGGFGARVFVAAGLMLIVGSIIGAVFVGRRRSARSWR